MALNREKTSAVAQKFLQKGLIDKAIREFKRLAEDDPNDVRIFLKLGALYLRQGSIHEATETYHQVARFYSKQGFSLKAVAVYKQILQINPTDLPVTRKLAELYQRLGLLSDAALQYRSLSNLYEQNGQTEEAIAALQTILGFDPEQLIVRIKLAEIYAKEQRYKKSVEEFQKVAVLLWQQNRVDDYIRVAERLLYLDPCNIPYAQRLAELYLSKEDPRKALGKLQVAFRANPKDTTTLELLGQAFMAVGQPHKSLSVWHELIRRYEEEGAPNARQDVAKKILAQSPDDAIAKQILFPPPPVPHPAVEKEVNEEIDIDIETDETYPETLSENITVELAEELDGRPSELDDFSTSFVDQFEEFKRGVAREVSLSDYQTHYDLGIAYKEMALYDDAIREFRLAQKAPEREVGALTLMGLCEADRGDYQAALTALRNALRASKVTREEIIALQYELGQVYETMGLLREAKQCYATVCANDASFRDARERLHVVSKEKPDSVAGASPRIPKVSYL